jgi:hypothetical protein
MLEYKGHEQNLIANLIMTKTKKFTDPPASDKLLTKLQNKILAPLNKNINVTIVTFKSAGKGSELKYLLSNYTKLPDFPQKKLYSWMDVSFLDKDEDKVYREALSYISNVFQKALTKKLETEITSLLQNENLSVSDFSKFIYSLTFEHGYSISLMLGDFRKAYSNNTESNSIVRILSQIKRVNPMKISLAFFCEEEFTSANIKKIKDLSLFFTQNKINGGEILFDDKSAEHLFNNHSGWKDFEYPQEYVNKAKRLSYGDPMTMKFLAEKASDNKNFINKMLTEKDPKKIYSLIDSEWLDLRYRKITNLLRRESIEYLLEPEEKEPTEFLKDTGLVIKNKEEWYFLNPLFEYYVTRDKSYLQDILTQTEKSGATEAASTDRHIKQALTAKELLVFELLELNEGKVVGRDSIAQVMWGKDWQDDYSDWAIDKLISNMRKKFEKNKYPKVLKAVKGEGILLT